MMRFDTKRHLEEEHAAFREEIVLLLALLYDKKSERIVAANLDLTKEEAPTKDALQAPATDKTKQNKTNNPAKCTHRLRVHYTREISESSYESLPESAERVSVRVESVPAHLARHIYCHPAFVRICKCGRKKREGPSTRQGASSPAEIRKRRQAESAEQVAIFFRTGR